MRADKKISTQGRKGAEDKKLRQAKFLLDIAAQFENASTPMNHDWLVENNVTLDEFGALCYKLAIIIRGFAQSPQYIQNTILACSVADDERLAAKIASFAVRKGLLEETIARIDREAPELPG